MSALVWKLISIIISVSILSRVTYLMGKYLIFTFTKLAQLLKINKKISEVDSEQDQRKWLDEYFRKEKIHRELVKKGHYDYVGFINLSLVQKDRDCLFEERWGNWAYSKNSHQLLRCPGDYQAQAIKMFGEMALARKHLILGDFKFWTEEKEKFWRKICHPAIEQVDVRGTNLFQTQELIIAMDKFNSEDFDRKVV